MKKYTLKANAINQETLSLLSSIEADFGQLDFNKLRYNEDGWPVFIDCLLLSDEDAIAFMIKYGHKYSISIFTLKYGDRFCLEL